MREVDKFVPRTTKVGAQDSLKAQAGMLPIIVVARRSADAERVALWLNCPADQEYLWRIEVRDSKGNIVPPRRRHSFQGGSGAWSKVPEKFGGTWQVVLPLSRDINLPEPGEYSVTIMCPALSDI